MIVVNLLGAPGSGKSTGAAYIFSQLKEQGINTELVQEFAKDKVYEQSAKVFQNQLYILGKQSFRLSRLSDVVDVAIIDSPLLLSCYYNGVNEADEDDRWHFNCVAMQQHKKYENHNYFIRRTKPYSKVGRFQTEQEAAEVAAEQLELLTSLFDDAGEEMKTVDGNKAGYDAIISDIMRRMESK